MAQLAEILPLERQRPIYPGDTRRGIFYFDSNVHQMCFPGTNWSSPGIGQVLPWYWKSMYLLLEPILNRPSSQIPQCICCISHNAPFRTEMCTCLFSMVLNRPNSHIPQCICPKSNNASFRTEMCTFLLWMVHCGIWNRCIVVFVRLVSCYTHTMDMVRCGYLGCLSCVD